MKSFNGVGAEGVYCVAMPEQDGFALCRAIRKESDIPLVMLTARGDVMDRVVGLELGADDYVTKPFSARELLAITKAWEGFFTAGGPVDSHIALLEDGAKFRAELTASAKDPSNAALVAKVTDVQISGTTAAVTYDLLGKGAVVLLGGSMGEAVQVAGAWKVSKKTYCQLVTLQDSTVAHPGCTT